jgi:hypothetical protein
MYVYICIYACLVQYKVVHNFICKYKRDCGMLQINWSQWFSDDKIGYFAHYWSIIVCGNSIVLWEPYICEEHILLTKQKCCNMAMIVQIYMQYDVSSDLYVHITCILQVMDARRVRTGQDMFECIKEHLKYAGNGGNIRWVSKVGSYVHEILNF